MDAPDPLWSCRLAGAVVAVVLAMHSWSASLWNSSVAYLNLASASLDLTVLCGRTRPTRDGPRARRAPDCGLNTRKWKCITAAWLAELFLRQ